MSIIPLEARGAPPPPPPVRDHPGLEHRRPVPAEEIVDLAAGAGAAAVRLVTAAERLEDALEDTARTDRLEAAAIAEAVDELRELLARLADGLARPDGLAPAPGAGQDEEAPR